MWRKDELNVRISKIPPPQRESFFSVLYSLQYFAANIMGFTSLWLNLKVSGTLSCCLCLFVCLCWWTLPTSPQWKFLVQLDHELNALVAAVANVSRRWADSSHGCCRRPEVSTKTLFRAKDEWLPFTAFTIKAGTVHLQCRAVCTKQHLWSSVRFLFACRRRFNSV